MFLPFCLFTFLPLFAQSFTQQVQTSAQGEGIVTIHHDKAIDDLVNGQPATHASTTVNSSKPTNTATAAKPTKTAAATPSKTSSSAAAPAKPSKTTKPSKPTKEDPPTGASATPTKPEKQDPPQKTDDNKPEVPATSHQGEIEPVNSADTVPIITGPRRTYKTTGYRVQVYAGGNTRRDRQKAEHTGNTLSQLFPEEEVYVHFYSPRWICRMGNYRTYEEARARMLEVRKMGYEAATVVKGKITLAY